MLLYIVYNLKEQEEMEKIIKNLEKLLNKDFEFINAGRIVIVADSRKVNVDMVNSICNKLKVETNHITKNELKKIIAELEIELDYLAPEIPKLKRD
jgi:intracellular sulfur oxidation DsrE/DsrF family protein